MSTYIIYNGNLSHAGIKGMRWGVRRYQNADGSLTDLGRKRYAKQVSDTYKDEYKKGVDAGLKNPTKNQQKIHEDATRRAVNAASLVEFDAGKETKKDLDATNTILKETGNVTREASNAVKRTNVKVKRMDLSKMSDQDMRARIAREQLESQYDSMFNPKRQRVESGKQTVSNILDGIGTATTITASALAIALAVKQLKG